jgi:glucosylglycerol 3-phosphatase
LVFQNGPKEYISWFIELANKRSNFKKSSWLLNFQMTIYK